MAKATAAGIRKGGISQRKQRIPGVIAIDGPAAAGKSTVGRQVAARLGYPFLDTGSMYRAITWIALHRGIDLGDEEALSDLARSARMEIGPAAAGSIEPCTLTVDGEDVTPHLRRPEVEAAVSLVSRIAGVREALVQAQRELAGRRPVVMAGRDIGTVVLPKANLKVYLEASVQERARRRQRELSALGQNVSPEEVQRDLLRRDSIDSQRPVSPLRPAEDSIVIDTEGLTLDEVVQRLLSLVEGGA